MGFPTLWSRGIYLNQRKAGFGPHDVTKGATATEIGIGKEVESRDSRDSRESRASAEEC